MGAMTFGQFNHPREEGLNSLYVIAVGENSLLSLLLDAHQRLMRSKTARVLTMNWPKR
jgi:hypothetical protein